MILVTGATGFVGSALIDKLEQHSFDVRPVSRNTTARNTNNYCIVENIDSTTNWRSALTDIDTVIHAAARVHIMKETSANALDEFIEINTLGTINLAKQAAENGVRRFIFISSIKVNGEQTFDTPFSEIDTPKPSDPYGISKYQAELALRNIAETTNMEVVIIRPVLVYGPGVKANFLNLMRLVQKSLPLPLGAIHNKRSLVSIDNLVDLIITCIYHPNAANQTFLVSDGADLSTTELLQYMAKAQSKNLILLPVPPSLLTFMTKLIGKPAIGQRLCGSLQVDISKTKDLLGWTPPVTIHEALEKTAKHLQGKY